MHEQATDAQHKQEMWMTDLRGTTFIRSSAAHPFPRAEGAGAGVALEREEPAGAVCCRRHGASLASVLLQRLG